MDEREHGCFMAEGMVVIDKDYRVVQANEAFLKSCGLKIDEVTGRHCYFVSHKKNGPCDEFGELCPLKKVMQTGESVSAVHTHTGEDGSAQTVELSASPIKDEYGEVVAVIEFSRKVKKQS